MPVPTNSPDYDRTWWSAAKERRLPVIEPVPPPTKFPPVKRNPTEIVRVSPIARAAATVAAMPVIAIAGPGNSQQECTGMGGEHMVFQILEVVRGPAVTVAHAGGHGGYGLFGSWGCDIYVVGIQPRPMTEDAHDAMCVVEPATDGDVIALVRAADLDHARAIAAALATWATPAAVSTPKRPS